MQKRKPRLLAHLITPLAVTGLIGAGFTYSFYREKSQPAIHSQQSLPKEPNPILISPEASNLLHQSVTRADWYGLACNQAHKRKSPATQELCDFLRITQPIRLTKSWPSFQKNLLDISQKGHISSQFFYQLHVVLAKHNIRLSGEKVMQLLNTFVAPQVEISALPQQVIDMMEYQNALAYQHGAQTVPSLFISPVAQGYTGRIAADARQTTMVCKDVDGILLFGRTKKILHIACPQIADKISQLPHEDLEAFQKLFAASVQDNQLTLIEIKDLLAFLASRNIILSQAESSHIRSLIKSMHTEDSPFTWDEKEALLGAITR